jgi:hypothetical protein
MRTCKTLRGALNQIERLLNQQSYSASLWDICTCLRGPDSRNKKIKYATTAIIRSAAFPTRPCEERSIYGRDSKELVRRRKQLFKNKEDDNHFRDHCRDAFEALQLSLYEINPKA